MQKERQFWVPVEGPSVSLSDQSGLESLGMMTHSPAITAVDMPRDCMVPLFRSY